MPKLLLGALAGLLFLVSCAPEKALDSLIPSNALAVVFVEKPAGVAQEFFALAKALGPGAPALPPEFPVEVLDLNRSMAAALLPFAGAEEPGVPALAFYLPIKEPQAMGPVQNFASKNRLTAYQIGGPVGNWAVLATPGAPVPMPLAAGKFFDLGRAHLSEEHGIAVYVNLKNLAGSSVVPDELRTVFPLLPALETELAGVLFGVYATEPDRNGAALRLTLQTDLKPAAKTFAQLKMVKSNKLEDWALWLDDRALVALAVDFPSGTAVENDTLATVTDPLLRQHLTNVRALVGPRAVFNLTGGLEPESAGPEFAGVLEAADPHALRQALKSLVASGAVQKNFLQFALDADTPLVYQDSPGGPLGLRSRLSLGPFAVNMAWGNGKAYFASGKDFAALDALVTAGRAVTAWKGSIPAGSSVLAAANPVAWKVLPEATGGAVHASLKVENGNARAQLWWGAENLKSVQRQAEQLLPALLDAALP